MDREDLAAPEFVARPFAPSAPSADQLRSRLLSPRQGVQMRPATHSHTISSRKGDRRGKLELDPSEQTNIFAKDTWNISNFQVIEPNAAVYADQFSRPSTVNLTSSRHPAVTIQSKPSQQFTRPKPGSLQPKRETYDNTDNKAKAIPINSIEETFKYFLSNDSEDMSFVHVTPRYNLEYQCKMDFYDLVIIGEPGNTESSARLSSKIGSKAFSSIRDKLCQLSKNGLLVKNSNRNSSELIPLQVFLRERNLCQSLKKKRFFLMFKELRVFTAWHLFARHQRLLRARKLLLERTYFSDHNIAHTLTRIKEAFYKLESDIELFYFHESSCIVASEYLAHQVNHILQLEPAVIERINNIGKIVVEQLQMVLDSKEHRDYVNAVIAGHPYSFLIVPGSSEGTVDWVKVRSIQRLQEDVKLKLENLLCMANYMMQSTLGRMIKRFWERFSLFVRGIHQLSRRSNIPGYWEIHSGQVQTLNLPEGVPESTNHSTGNATMIIPEEYAKQNNVPINSFLVDKDWLEEGSHLSVKFIVTLQNRPSAAISDFLLQENIRLLKLTITPSKKELSNELHKLLGSIGALLENLPNLRQHPLVSRDRFAFGTDKVNLEEENQNDDPVSSSSRSYFTKLQINPLLGYEIGLSVTNDAMAEILEAHATATRVDKRKQQLEDCFKKLCSLNPEGLIKQINFSLVLPKVMKLIETPELVDECQRALTRDKNRLNSLQNLVLQLELTENSQHYFAEVKHVNGMVSSFGQSIMQLQSLCTIQKKIFYGKLPNAFLNRTKRLCEYLLKLEDYLNLKDTGLVGLIELLKKLKNYDNALPMLELEFEICQSVYNMFGYDENPPNPNSDSSQASEIPSINPNPINNSIKKYVPESLIKASNAQHKSFLDLRDKLLATVVRGKSLLLGLLIQVKNDTNENRAKIHAKIAKYMEFVCDGKYADTTGSAALLSRSLRDHEYQISQLHEEVQDVLSTQHVLVEAHDIVGAASPVLMVSEIDQFKDMKELLDELNYRKKCWDTMVEFNSLTLTMMNSRLGKCDVKDISISLDSMNKIIAELESMVSSHQPLNDVVKLLKEKFIQLRPKLELVTFLSTKALRVRHFQQLSDDVFASCGFIFRFSGRNNDVLTVVDKRSRDASMSLGSLESLQVSLLLSRGLALQLNRIRYISAEAVLEAMIESTLIQIEETIRSANVATSADWLRDSKLREKIFFELYEAINLTQLSVIVHFCLKGALVLEQLSLDMNLAYFNNRIESVRECLLRLDRFIENVRDIQDKWMYVFHYVKFSSILELDRDTTKSYQTCTEELKRVELAIQQKSGNILHACVSLVDHEASIENCKQSLLSIMEDAHSNIQSCLDGAPRLSLLSYTRLHQLVTAWLIGPQHQVDFVSECFHDMFEGIGTLKMVVNRTLRTHCCSGFCSYDACETILFDESIDFTTPLSEFVNRFEHQLRLAISSSSDNLMLCRIQSIRSLLNDVTSPTYIIKNADSIFNQRIQQLLHFASDDFVNQSYVLVNACIFAEDLWTCLGHPTGSLLLARSDLQQDGHLFASSWRESIQKLTSVCKFNLQHMLDYLHGTLPIINMRPKKAKALLTALFFQEVGFLRTAEKLMLCKSVESACELWAGQLQYKFVYNKEYRIKLSPFDVVMGCVTVAYGLEYQGGYIHIVVNPTLEEVVQKAISSSFGSHASVIVNAQQEYSPSEADGEFVVTVKDIAALLGRICLPLTSIPAAGSVKLFLSRLVYLDAVGCIDFTCLGSNGMQMLVSTLNSFWKAFETKNDVLFRESLKFPLQTRFGVTEAQLQRKKENLVTLREYIDVSTKYRKYPGIILIGLASDSVGSSSDGSVFDYEVFNVISVPHCIPVDSLGMFLTVEGYKYGHEIKDAMIATMSKLKSKYPHFANLVSCLSSTRFIRNLVAEAGKVLSLRSDRLHTANIGTERFKIELNCFAVILWESILVLGDEVDSNNGTLQTDTIMGFEEMYLELAKESLLTANAYNRSLNETLKAMGHKLVETSESTSYFSVKSLNSRRMIPRSISNNIRTLTRERGLWNGDHFVEYCSSFWNIVSNSSHVVSILSGPSGAGKSSIIDVVVDLIRKIGFYPDLPRSSIGPIKSWRAAFIIAKTLTNWYRGPLFSLWKHTKHPTPKHDVSEANHENGVSHEANMRQLHTELSNNPDAQSNSAKMHLLKKVDHKFHRANVVNVVVLHHTSLTYEALVGGFDANGRWRDGLFLRKVRQASSASLKRKAYHIIILDGPVSYFTEQIFGSFYCMSQSAHSFGLEDEWRSIVFPNSEVFKIPESLRFVLETNDLKQASPAISTHLPHFHISLEASAGCERLVRVWVRSIRNWLDNFPPWREAMHELARLLLGTSFVTDFLLGSTESVSSMEVRPSIVISKTSTFLRYLEELLGQCHTIACSEATYLQPESDDSSVDSNSVHSDDSSNVANYLQHLPDLSISGKLNFNALTMVLGEQGRERLMKRMQLSVVYSIVWAFGGHLDCNKSRQLFDHILRERVYSYFNSSIEIGSESNIFNLSLDLVNCQFLPADMGNCLAASFDLPQRMKNLRIKVDRSFRDSQKSGELFFRTPEMIALDESVRLLVSSGGLPLIFGLPNSGKSTMVKAMLADFKSNLKSPQQIKDFLLSNLLDIINARKDPQGEALTLLVVQQTLKKLSNSNPILDNHATFGKIWNSMLDDSKAVVNNPTMHCKNKSVFSTSTSMGSHASADSLKSWIINEFSSEVKDCVESPRFTYGLIFFDDVHLVAAPKTEDEIKLIDNRSEAVFKSLLSNYPAFGIKRNVRVRLGSAGFSGPSNGSMPRAKALPPVLHKNHLTDPRVECYEDDNYIMQSLGVISCASGLYDKLAATTEFEQFVSHYGMFSFQTMSVTEIHAALILGSYVALESGGNGNNIVSTLKAEIIELSNITVSICKRMVSSVDTIITSQLEKAIRSIVHFDINLVSQFCKSLQLGSSSLSNPGGLLQLVAHEWKRYFVDPFPLGPQRERFVLLFKEELESIDYKKWFLSRQWYENVLNSFDPLIDRVWFDPTVFSTNLFSGSNNQSVNAEQQNKRLVRYLPIELMQQASPQSQSELNFAIDTVDHFAGSVDSGIIDCSEAAHASLVGTDLFFPAAMSMVLRLVRILSCGNHLLVSGYLGSLQNKGIDLACKIANKTVYKFEAKQFSGSEVPTSIFAAASSKLKRFLKSAVLCATGFVNLGSDCEEKSFNLFHQTNTVSYQKIECRNVVAVISHAQQLPLDDQRLLLATLDCSSAIQLFEDYEIIGLAECLAEASRKKLLAEISQVKSIAIESTFEPLISNNPKATNRPQGNTDQQYSSHFKGKNSLSGYAYHWVKKYFTEVLTSSLLIAVDCYMPKPTHLVPTDSKFTSKSSNPNVPANTEEQAAFISTKRISRKFSLMSKSSKESPPKSATATVDGNTLTIDSNLLATVHTSPMMTSAFRQRFSSVWWELDECVAASGICNLLLSNDNRDAVKRFDASSIKFTKLLLKCVSIGEYFDHEAAAQVNANINDTVDSHGNRTINSKKPSKKVSNKWTHVIDAFPYCIKTRLDLPASCYFGIFDQLGVFASNKFDQSVEFIESSVFDDPLQHKHYFSYEIESLQLNSKKYKTKYYNQHSQQLLSAKRLFIDAVKEECSVVLPHLLTHPIAACDCLSLSSPVVCISHERAAELATEIVLSLVDNAANSIFVRRYYLLIVLDSYHESKQSLLQLDFSIMELARQIEDINAAIRHNSTNLLHLRSKIENIQLEHKLSTANETAQLIKEEILSRAAYYEQLDIEIHESMAQAKQGLLLVTQAEWYNVAALFASKPKKYLIDVMKTAMIVINYTLPTEPKKKGKSAPKSEAESIAKSSLTLLRSVDFVNQLMFVNPVSLLHYQLEAIVALRDSLAVVSDVDVMDPRALERAAVQTLENPVMDRLKRFLFVLTSCRRKLDIISTGKQVIVSLQESRSSLVTDNSAVLSASLLQLQQQIDFISEQMEVLDIENLKTRKKIEMARHLQDQQQQIANVISIHESIVQREINHLDNILSTLVSDGCASAVLFARSSWLPEELRSNCLSALRNELISLGIKTSDSVFSLGNLLSTSDINKWTAGRRESIPRFPFDINNFSMALLSPMHTLVIDPDGLAEASLCALAPKHYNIATIAASKFALAQFEMWCKQTVTHGGGDGDGCSSSSSSSSRSSEDNGLFVIVTDVQAGCSDDLIALLASDFRPSIHKEAKDPTSSSAIECSEQFTVEMICCPQDMLYPAQTALSVSCCRIRLYLVTSTAPVQNELGFGSPLPTCCFKNMAVVNWGSNDAFGFIEEINVESKLTAKSSSYESCQLTAFSRAFGNRYSIYSDQHKMSLSQHTLNLVEMKEDLMHREYSVLCKWMLEERDGHVKLFQIPGLIEITPVNLGFLSNHSIIELVLATEKQRYSIELDISTNAALESEQVAYEKAVMETLGMSMDYIKAVRYVVPVELLPPFALTTRALLSKCFTPALEKGQPHMIAAPKAGTKFNKFFGVPPSCKVALKSIHCIIKVQRKYRQLSQKRRGGKAVRPQGLFRSRGESRVNPNNSKTLELIAAKAKSERALKVESQVTSEPQNISSKTIPSESSPKNMQHVPCVYGREVESLLYSVEFMLSQLREFFLREVVTYIMHSIRPGYEWLGKLALMLVMWSKSEYFPAEEEMRTLHRLVKQSIGSPLSRYVLLTNIKNHEIAKTKKTIRKARNTVNHLLNNRSSFFASPTSSTVTTTMATNASAVLTTETITCESVGLLEENDSGLDEVATDLIGKLTIDKRKTAYRVGVGAPGGSLREQAMDLLDSILIHKMSLPHVGEPNDASSIPTRLGFLGDQRKLKKGIMPEQRIVYNGDSFEIEWQQNCGVKVFSTVGLRALPFIGAPEKVIAAIAESITIGRASAKAFSHRRTSTKVGDSRMSMLSRKNIGSPRLTARSTTLSLSTASRSNRASTVSISPRSPLQMKVEGSNSSSSDPTNRPSAYSGRLSRIVDVPKKSFQGGSADAATVSNSSSTMRHSSALGAMVKGLTEKRMSTLSSSAVSDRRKSRNSFASVASSLPTNADTQTAYQVNAIEKDAWHRLLSVPAVSAVYMKQLENHSSLSTVFNGITEAIEDKLEEFISWKNDVLNNNSWESQPLNEGDVEDFIDKLVPPVFGEDEDGNFYECHGTGLWVQGFEPTVIQTLIFAEVVCPGMAGALANGWFSCVNCFLQQGGNIVVHQDELLDDDFEAEMQYSGLDTDENALQEGEENEEDDEEGEGDDKFDFHAIITEVGNKAKEKFASVYVQPDVVITNCWTKLRRVLTGRSQARGSVPMETVGKYQIMYRDIENWESVMQTVIAKQNSIDRYTFMNALRTSLHEEGTIFLCSSSVNQMTALSQRARSLGVHNDTLMAVIRCIQHGSGFGTSMRSAILEQQKQVRLAIATTRMHKAIVEHMSVFSPLGNSILDIGLLMSGKGVQSGVTASEHASATASGAIGSAVGGATVSASHASVQHAGAVVNKDSAQAGSSSHSSHKIGSASKVFPLIVSCEWVAPVAGTGPLVGCFSVQYAWLPRFSCADIMETTNPSSTDRPVKSADSNQFHFPPGLLESAGVVFEELESCLLWVMISCRTIVNANISMIMLKKIRYAKKTQVRVVSGLIALWHLVLYQRNFDKEKSGRPTNWSECIVPLSMWQLARLLIKSSEILETFWDLKQFGNSFEDRLHGLKKLAKFAKAIDLLTESFGFIESMELPIKDKSSKLSSRASKVFNNSQQSPDRSSRSSQIMTPSRPTALPSSTSRGHARPMHTSDKMGESNVSTAESRRNISFTAAGLSSTAALRLKKKAAIVAAKTVSKRLEQLRSVERFSLFVSKDIAATIVSNREIKEREEIARTIQREGNNALLVRLKGCLAAYLADIIIRKEPNSNPSTTLVSDNNSYVLGNSSTVGRKEKDFQGRTSMKLDIQNIMNIGSFESIESEDVCDFTPFDLTVGNLDPDELLQCFVRWTFDSTDDAQRGKISADKKFRVGKQLIASLLSKSKK